MISFDLAFNIICNRYEDQLHLSKDGDIDLINVEAQQNMGRFWCRLRRYEYERNMEEVCEEIQNMGRCGWLVCLVRTEKKLINLFHPTPTSS